MAIDAAEVVGEGWWQDFFTGAWLDVHGQMLTPEHTEAEIEFIWKAAGLEPGMRVLDVPCGDGRITAPLAARGLRMTGVDITPALLERARRRCESEGQQVEFRHGDMRELADEGVFDAVLNCWGSEPCFPGAFHPGRRGTRSGDCRRAVARNMAGGRLRGLGPELESLPGDQGRNLRPVHVEVRPRGDRQAAIRRHRLRTTSM